MPTASLPSPPSTTTRNPAILDAVACDRAEGRFWVKIELLHARFGQQFGVSTPADFRAAGSRTRWTETCGMVQHQVDADKQWFIPSADCDHEVKDAHQLMNVLRAHKEATRMTALSLHDTAQYLVECRSDEATAAELLAEFKDTFVAQKIDTHNPVQAEAYARVLGPASLRLIMRRRVGE